MQDFLHQKNKLHKKISEKKVKKMSQLLVPTTKMVAVVTKKVFTVNVVVVKEIYLETFQWIRNAGGVIVKVQKLTYFSTFYNGVKFEQKWNCL